MINIQNVTKHFGDYAALSSITMEIPKGEVFGLVGTNGSGKSTLLRILSGVYSCDEGEVTLENQKIWENPEVKSRIFFVCDDIYFLPQATLDSMAAFYRSIYPNWNDTRYEKLLTVFPLGRKKKISTFSKGMKRQAALILALAAAPDYLLLDEAFDGLDPVIRFAVRRLLADIMYELKTTVIISSHNLRELEDFCNVIGLIHKGHLVFQCNMENISTQFAKAQIVLKNPVTTLPDIGIRVLSSSIRGSVATVVCQCSEDQLLEAANQLEPILCETMPLNLEEVFIYEMEAVDYDYKDILF